jgi:hypothetical protein
MAMGGCPVTEPSDGVIARLAGITGWRRDKSERVISRFGLFGSLVTWS